MSGVLIPPMFDRSIIALAPKFGCFVSLEYVTDTSGSDGSIPIKKYAGSLSMPYDLKN